VKVEARLSRAIGYYFPSHHLSVVLARRARYLEAPKYPRWLSTRVYFWCWWLCKHNCPISRHPVAQSQRSIALQLLPLVLFPQGHCARTLQ